MNSFAELRQYMAIVMRWWWLIAAAAIAGAAIGYVASRSQPSVYTAYTTLIVGQSIEASNLETKDLQVSEQLAQTYANLVGREPVLQGTVAALNLSGAWQALQKRVRVNLVENTQFLEISVEASSPDEARLTADEIARQLILHSPTAGQQDSETSFVRRQLENVQTKIEAGQTQVDELKTALAELRAAESSTEQRLAAQVQEIQSEISTLNRLIADWQSNYVQLSSLALSRSPDDPFVSRQLEILQAQIENGQARVKALEESIADVPVSADPASTVSIASPNDQAQELQQEIHALEALIADWQNNYTQLLQFAETRKKPTNYLAVVETAQIDPAATRPRTLLNTLVASGVGLILALGFIFLKEQLDNTVKSADDFSRFLGLNFLGAVGRIKAKRYPDQLVTVHESLSPVAEAYRIIRGNIQLRCPDHKLPRSIMVTSPTRSDGKSLTAANVGVVTAQAGFKTILVDADPRRPVIHQIFSLPNEKGLADWLSDCDPEVALPLVDTTVENLKVVPSGVLRPNFSELLSSSRTKEIIAGLEEIADMVIFDSPPVLATADTTVLSMQVDGVVLVVEAEETDRDKVKQAIRILQQVDAHLLGGVLNRVSHPSVDY